MSAKSLRELAIIIFTIFATAIGSWLITVFANNFATKEQLMKQEINLNKQFTAKLDELKDNNNSEITKLKVQIAELNGTIKANNKK